MSGPDPLPLADEASPTDAGHLLRQARNAPDPAFDHAASLARLVAALPPPEAVQSGAQAGTMLKIAGLVGAVAVAAVVALSLRGAHAPETTPSPTAPLPTSIASTAPAPTANELQIPSVSIDSLPRVEASGDARSPSPTASADRASMLRQEIDHLARMRALEATDPAGAARMGDEGHRRFRGGVLYQEREAVAIRALARADRTTAASARAARFVHDFPDSPLAEPMRRYVVP